MKNPRVPTTPEVKSVSHVSPGVLLTAIVLVALNLRAALSSLPTVVTDVQDATGWSDATLGVLTTIPVLCMGLLALAVPALVMRLGRKKLVTVAMLSLTVAMLIRASEAIPALLFVSAFLAGLGIALSSGVIPGIVREQLPESLGKANALWTAALMGSAALGAAFTVPIAIWLDSWSLALAAWALPAIVALVFWLFAERNSPRHDRSNMVVKLSSLPWRNKLAWALTLNMTINSIVFYSSVAWIAPSFVERGWSQEDAGWLFGVFAAAQVVSALILAGLSTRITYRRTLFVGTILATVFSLLAIGWLPEFYPWIPLLIFGFFLSGTFAMLLGLLSEYSSSAASAAKLTAMAFSITYTVAAFGPFFSGILLDTFDSWPMVYSALACIALSQLLVVRPLTHKVLVA